MTETVKTERKSNEQIASENKRAAIRVSYGRKKGRDARAAKRAEIIQDAVAKKIADAKKAARARKINEFYSQKAA